MRAVQTEEQVEMITQLTSFNNVRIPTPEVNCFYVQGLFNQECK